MRYLGPQPHRTGGGSSCYWRGNFRRHRLIANGSRPDSETTNGKVSVPSLGEVILVGDGECR
jgi:hypothetical protein